MKIRSAISTAALAVLAAGVFAVQAQVASAPPETIFVAPPIIPPGSPLHGGAVTPEDHALLARTLDALANARDMEGSTVTIIAKNGELIMNGSAKDYEQAGRIERIAKGVVGGSRVTAMIDPQGA